MRNAEAVLQSEVSGGKLRLAYLDGIRGLAAIGVVIRHLTSHEQYGVSEMHAIMPRFFAATWQPLRLGVHGLSIFIVLSGYCLMLPVVRSADMTLRGGTLEYIRRRAKRILPAYYAAFLLTIAFCYILIPNLQILSPHWYSALNENEKLFGFEMDGVAAHLFLIHNLKSEWVSQYNGSLWSLATEWQIYFLLPALILPAWRRFQNLWFVPLAILLGFLPQYLLPEGANFDWARPWFFGLFAMGAAGALIGFVDLPTVTRLRERISWTGIVLILGTIWALCWPETENLPTRILAIQDTFAGMITTCLLILFARSAALPAVYTKSYLVKLFETRFILFLGSFSYSIYLVHYPILHNFTIYLVRQHFSVMKFCILLWCLGIPLILLSAYGFYLLFERPFLKIRHNSA